MPLDAGNGYVLELARAGSAKPILDFAQDLLDRTDRLVDEDVFLIILATPGEWDACRVPASAITVVLVPPTAKEIIERRLTDRYGCADRLQHLGIPPLIELMTAELPRQAR